MPSLQATIAARFHRICSHNTEGFGHAVAVLAGGTALAQAIPIAASPILTRLYTPAEFGILALFTSALAILTAVAGCRFELSVVLAATKREAANLLALTLLTLTLTSCIVFAIGSQRGLQTVSSLSKLQPYATILAAAVWLVAAFTTVEHWAIRTKAWNWIAAARIRQGCAAALCQCALVKLGAPGTGLLVGHTIGQALGVLTLAKRTGATDPELIKEVTVPRIVKAAKQNWQYPAFVMPSALVNTLGLQVPILLLVRYYGSDVAGWYALGQRIIGLPLFFIGRAVSQAYLGEATRLAFTSPARLGQFFLKTATRLAIAGAISTILMASLAPFIIRPIFGAAWTQAGFYLQLLAPSFLASFVTSPLSQTLNITHHVRLAFFLDCFRLMCTWGALVGAKTYGAQAWQAILVLSLTSAGCYGIYFATYLYLLTQNSKEQACEGAN